jgi:hypothetical protein
MDVNVLWVERHWHGQIIALQSVVLHRALLLGALACLSWAALVFTTGGLDWSTPAFRLSSRDPFRPVVMAVLLILGYWFLARDRVAAAATHLELVVQKHGRLLSGGLALGVLLVGLVWGTTAVGGSDPYGYSSEADLWKAGRLTIDQSFFQPWPYEEWTLAPLGYRPGLDRHTIVPTYPPGLPLLIAAADIVSGPRGRALVIPVFGAIAVWLTFVLGVLIVDEVVGLFAALLMAASPAFLYHITWTMSDVPATATWTLALVLALWRRPTAAGVVSGLAIAIRPNLLFLAVGVGLIAVWSGPIQRQKPPSFQALFRFGLGILPAILGLALFNTHLYGAPWRFGYPEGLFSWRNVWPNATRYARWLVQTQTLLWILAIPFLLSRRFAPGTTLSQDSIVRAGLSALLAAFVLSYLPYARFDEWTYVRFLLPAFPVLLVAALGCIRSIKALYGSPSSIAVLTVVTILVFAWEISTAKALGAFTIASDLEQFSIVARDVRDLTPERSVLFSMFHSGSARYYSGRMTIRYDFLPEPALDEAVDMLAARGLRSYFLLESWEIELARQRFSLHSTAGRFEQAPVKQWDFSNRMVRLYEVVH